MLLDLGGDTFSASAATADEGAASARGVGVHDHPAAASAITTILWEQTPPVPSFQASQQDLTKTPRAWSLGKEPRAELRGHPPAQPALLPLTGRFSAASLSEVHSPFSAGDLLSPAHFPTLGLLVSVHLPHWR